MKKLIKSNVRSEQAREILDLAKNLLDAMDSVDESLLEDADLIQLYDELIDTIPGLSLQINNGSLDEDAELEDVEDFDIWEEDF